LPGSSAKLEWNDNRVLFIKRHSNVLLVLILIAALAIRISLFLYVSPKPMKLFTPDSYGYDQIAVNLLQHGAFSTQTQQPLTPDLERTPGYPAMIAAVYALAGHSPEAVILLQLLLGVVIAGLTFYLAFLLGMSAWVGLLAAGYVAVEPVSAMTSNLLLTETMFTALLVAGILLLVLYWKSSRWRWLVIGAGFFGLAALTRPVSQFLPLSLALIVVWTDRKMGWRRAALAALLFTGISMSITYSWAYRNYTESGLFTLSTVSDINLVYYRAREVVASVEGVSQEEARRQLETRVAQILSGRETTPSETASLQRQLAISIFTEHPSETAAMAARGTVRIFADPGYSTACTLLDRDSTDLECFAGEATMNEADLWGIALSRYSQMNPVQQLILIWSVLIATTGYLCSAWGLVRLFRERRWLPVSTLVAVCGYLVLFSAGAEAYSRFRIPMVPFMAILAAAGAEGLLHSARAARSKPKLERADRMPLP
jgi:4-amino-4-deoxy-L-arabinose transferase-like glycosyltransferase